MIHYIIQRLVGMVLTILVVSVAVFVLLRVAPGDPALAALGMEATDEQIAAVHKQLGLDQPLPVQYFDWLRQVSTGDLGESFITKADVGEQILERLPVTAELILLTFVFTAALGVPLGMLAGARADSSWDHAVRFFSTVSFAVPAFWIGTLALIVPSQLWGYSPPLGTSVSFLDDPSGNLRQFVPPAFILSLAGAATVMRYTRSSLLEVLRQDYVRTAHAKGLPYKDVLLRHALRNSLAPVVTVLGLQVGVLIAGAVVIEQIFSLRGLGTFMLQALTRKDYAVIQTMTLYIAIGVITINLLVDLLYAWLDPRVVY